MGRYNLSASLPLISGRIGGHYELPPPVVPVRTFFCRSRTVIFLPAPGFPPAGSRRRRNGAVLAPAELATIDPHAVQNHGQTPTDRDDGSTDPAPLSHPHAHAFSHDHFVLWVSSDWAAS